MPAKIVKAVIYLFLASLPPIIHTQPSPKWQTLPNAPVVSRHNDAYFVTQDLGWIVNGSGQIFKTTDGGSSWDLLLDQNKSHFRSVGFFDSLRGYAGNVGEGEFETSDPIALYQTANGGTTWQPFSHFYGPPPKGICGMHIVNDSTICAVGCVRGPAFFVRTIDGGASWQSKDMAEFAAGLIDVYLFHPDSGFAVGLTDVDHSQSSGIVLSTTDGGQTWEKRFATTRTGEWCWKLNFPSRRVGYASLQRNSRTPISFVKTTDGGQTWQEKLFSESYYFVQGIGFVNEQTGWIGGNSTFPTFVTTDGGESWQSAGFGSRVNRLRFLSDSLGYAVGRTVYKYSNEMTVGIVAIDGEKPADFLLEQNYPNPFNTSTTIRYHLPSRAMIPVKLFDINGRQIKTLVEGVVSRGNHAIDWNGTDDFGKQMGAGVYFCALESEGFRLTRKLLLVR